MSRPFRKQSIPSRWDDDPSTLEGVHLPPRAVPRYTGCCLINLSRETRTKMLPSTKYLPSKNHCPPITTSGKMLSQPKAALVLGCSLSVSVFSLSLSLSVFSPYSLCLSLARRDVWCFASFFLLVVAAFVLRIDGAAIQTDTSSGIVDTVSVAVLPPRIW